MSDEVVPAAHATGRLDGIVSRWAARQPDRHAIVVPDGDAWTWAELDRAVEGFAAGLRHRGIESGQRIVLGNFNTPEFFVAFFGAMRVGAVAVPLDPRLAAAELRNVIQHASPRAVVVDARSMSAFEDMGVECIEVREVLARHRAADGPRDRTPAVTEREPAFIIYTSGTTGTPQGAVHSHAGILQKVEDIRSWFALRSEHKVLCVLPTHFGHGLVCSCLSALNCGGTLVLGRPFDVELLPRIFDIAERYQVTTFSTVPTIIRLLLRSSAGVRPAPKSLEFITCASAPLHPDEIDAFEQRFGILLLNCYGSTEAGTWSAMSPRDPARDRRSVGMAVGCLARAVDPDGRPLPAGETGELQLRGPSLMLGYVGAEQATARVLRDGWLSTGDLGSVDEQGRVFLAGRLKELIIRAGVNIYPAEIEGVLMRHGNVAEAYVVGLTHEILGEMVAACVVLKAATTAAPAELQAHCRRYLAPYKCPERFQFVPSVPKTSRGKVSRTSLRALFAG